MAKRLLESAAAAVDVDARANERHVGCWMAGWRMHAHRRRRRVNYIHTMHEYRRRRVNYIHTMHAHRRRRVNYIHTLPLPSSPPLEQ